MMNRKYVITGGPGSGKTSLINGLAGYGHPVFEEVSRRLIQEQAMLPDGALPWTNISRFASLALHAMARQYREASHLLTPCFFDRGLPDIEGYLGWYGAPLHAGLPALYQTHRYAPTVFICPPWKDIYVNDAERPQSFDDAQALHRLIKAAYERQHYEVVTIPFGPVASRVDFIEQTLHTVCP